jgi:asparagine synthase (glutamine-hydrolysing)
MFAFVLHDARWNVLLMARDRASEKPMFYQHYEKGLAIASEIKVLLELNPD